MVELLVVMLVDVTVVEMGFLWAGRMVDTMAVSTVVRKVEMTAVMTGEEKVERTVVRKGEMTAVMTGEAKVERTVVKTEVM